jgi:16S rRNA C1402 (ribose-2'-O) methylase RsmI
MNVISDPGARFPRAVREHNRLGPVGPQESRTFLSN